ncbi:Uncharacterised protein [Enterobacter hormaechei]|nr:MULTISPECIES: hypothetical protein [Enterobacteriaceae]MCE9984695.1 hypothetical protein [Leclercia adecarboxylata]MDU1983696.1 hypothetical protein [Streptococcus parasanguinis]VAE21395.1 Uncharacterised protein [Enterobacter hormaechei]VAE27005.1 Uncharacterised protein [Enterobacter hormaechei]
MDSSDKTQPDLLRIQACELTEHTSETVNVQVDAGDVKPVKRKVTFEFEPEKLLRRSIIILALIASIIVGYQVFNYTKAGILSLRAETKIAVLDMPEMREAYLQHMQESIQISRRDNESNFQNYLAKVLKLYRGNDFLVIDSKLTLAIPKNIKIVTYIDPEELDEELTSMGINLNSDGLHTQ